MTSTGGSNAGNPLSIVAIGPDGSVIVDQDGAFSEIFPVGTYVNWGPYTTAPSVTVTGVTNPFGLLTGLSSFSGLQIPYGSYINWGPYSVAPSTFTITENGGSTIARPFLSYRDLGLLGVTNLPTANVVYEARAVSMYLSLATSSSATIVVYDQPGNTVSSTTISTSTPFFQRLEPGYRLSVTAGSISSATVTTSPR
jgi:hypothetical protein